MIHIKSLDVKPKVLLFGLLEVQSFGVDGVSQAGGLRPVFEDMT
jgi:hypothetical protein